jgi:hypothetical protein
MPYRQTERFARFLSKHVEGLKVPDYSTIERRTNRFDVRLDESPRSEPSRHHRGRLLRHQGPQRGRLDHTGTSSLSYALEVCAYLKQ